MKVIWERYCRIGGDIDRDVERSCILSASGGEKERVRDRIGGNSGASASLISMVVCLADARVIVSVLYPAH
jgi:hypothetical protein